MKRVAGVEPLLTSLPGVPPAHDIQGSGETDAASGSSAARITARQASGMDSNRFQRSHSPESPADAFGKHFFRCFFCRIGDNRIEDHFCETGRELIVAMLDELHDREFA